MPEWRSTLDALQELPEIGPDGPVGYFGLNMGTAVGVPLVGAHKEVPRFEADSAVRFFARHLRRPVTAPA